MSNVSLVDGHIDGMTDEQIIKALERCSSGMGCGVCKDCPLKYADCLNNLEKYALDLINRQKAEIERKTNHIAEITDEYANFKEAVKRREQAVVKNIERVADEEINGLKAEIEESHDAHIRTIVDKNAEIARLEKILDKRCDVCPAVITARKEF